MPSKLIITHLNHDLAQKKSYVSFIWSDDPTKRLGLEVPHTTTLETAEAAAQAAIAGFIAELGEVEIKLPDSL